jgi:hypothetical protein
MVEYDVVPVALAAVGMAGLVAFVVGASALAGQHGGVWAGVTTTGAFLIVAAVTLLYAVGTVDDRPREDRRWGR